jgi:methionyl-tRNA formyltransferase
MIRGSLLRRYRSPRILFFGGDEVSVVCLSALVARLGGSVAAAQHVEVVAPTAPPLQELEEARPPGHSVAKSCRHQHRAFPVVRFCHKHGIPCHVLDHPTSIPKCSAVTVPLLHSRSSSRFDVAVVASFRYFLPSSLLQELPPCINMHPSALPKFRGASPIFTTLLRGETECGASIIKLSPGELMDSGDIIQQRILAIRPQDDIRTVFPAVTKLGAALLLSTIFRDDPNEIAGSEGSIATWAALEAVPPASASLGPPMWCGQSFSDAWRSASPQANKVHFRQDPFHAPILDKHCSELCFDTMTGLECHCVWRAFAGGSFFKPAHCVLQKTRLAPAVRNDLMSRMRHTLARKARCEVHDITEKEVVRELTVTFTVVEAVHPDLVMALVFDELQQRVGCAAVPPGSAYFPKCDLTVAAIACGGGGVSSWFFWRVGTVKGSTPQTSDTIRRGLALSTGVVYEQLFAQCSPKQSG